MARQGIAGLATPDEDTPYEKELRRKLQALYEEMDPRYREAHLPQIGMGLGQVAAMAGTAMVPVVGKPLAIAGAGLMGAGEASGRIAEYEERTGQDVSRAKEILALTGGLGIGFTEMLPIGRLAGRFGRKKAIETAAGMGVGKIFQSAAHQAAEEAVQEGLAGFGQSALSRALYDPDALVDAGSEALKEAILGGEVGAIADVLTSLATAKYGRYARRTPSYEANLHLQKALDEKIRSGKIDNPYIERLITGPDDAGIEERFRSIENPTERERLQYEEELGEADQLTGLRKLITDGESAETLSGDISARKREEVERLRSMGRLTDKERLVRIDAIDRDDATFKNLIGQVRAGIKAGGPEALARFAEEKKARAEEKLAADLAPLEVQDVVVEINELKEVEAGIEKVLDDVWGKGAWKDKDQDTLNTKPSGRKLGDELFTVRREIGEREELLGRVEAVQGSTEASELTTDDLPVPLTYSPQAVLGHLQDIIPRPATDEEIRKELGQEEYAATRRIKGYANLRIQLRAAKDQGKEDDAARLQDELSVLEAQVDPITGLSLETIRSQEYQDRRIENWKNNNEPVEVLKLRMETKEQRNAINVLLESQELNAKEVSDLLAAATPKALIDRKTGEKKTTLEEEALQHILGFTARADVGTQLEEQAIDAEPVAASPVPLPAEGDPYDAAAEAARTGAMGELKSTEMLAVYDVLQKNDFVITEDILKDTLRAKNYKVPDNFFETDFYTDLITSTYGVIPMVRGKVTPWNQLNRGLKEAVFSRILRLPTRPVVTQVERIKRAELRAMQLSTPLRGQKSAEVEVRDISNLIEARKRAMGWIANIKEEVRKRNIPDLNRLSFTIDADVGQLMEDVEDLTINGVFTTDAAGNTVYRPAYEGGAVAGLQSYGTQLVFNLSQIEKRYKQGLDTEFETLIKDTTIHEGTHIHVLKDLTDSERRALDIYGRNQHVPKEVDQDAAKRDLTWRQYVGEKYADLPDADLTEETSVSILDALAQGKIPEAKSAGTIGKIKRALRSRFEAVVGATRDTDILPVLRIFESIQNREILQRRERNDSLVQKAASLQLVERADPEDIIRLKDAIKEGDQPKIAQIADQIIESRLEPTRKQVEEPTEVLLESLVNDLRARKEFEDTPIKVVNSVLNFKAIEDGTISPAALDAYFRFRDGRKPAYRMPLEARESWWGWGKSGIPESDAVRAYTAEAIADGLIGESEPGPRQIITAMDSQMRRVEKGLRGDDRWVGTSEDLRELIDYKRKDLLRKKFLDKRLPMWKSSKRAFGKEIKLYETTLGRLAEHAAITAWRFADNAMNFIPAVMEQGMLSYVNGGFRRMPLQVDGRRVKGLMDIFQPILQLGKSTESATLAYMATLRVRGVRDALRQAQENRRMLPADAPLKTVSEADYEIDYWEDTYNRTNPINPKTGNRLIPEDKIESRILEVEDGATAGIVEFQAVMKFAEEYQDFNIQLIEFSHQTGILSSKERDRMRSMPYIPFYRDRGWEESVPLENQQNATVEKEVDELLSAEEAGEEDIQLRGAPLIEKAIRGSFMPIRNDLLGNITKNVQALIRDGMVNVAGGRTMRDELANGTAVDIPNVPPAQYIRKRYLENRIADDREKAKSFLPIPEGSPIPRELEALNRRIAKDNDELSILNKDIRTINDRKRALNAELDAKGFSSIVVKVRGVTTSTWKGDTPETRTMETVIEKNGVTKTYRVIDPMLSQSIMASGFSPMKALEDFFGKVPVLGKHERFSTGLTKLLTYASRGLREAVTRAPPFQIKNVLRDSMQASVVFGGGPELVFKALKNIVDPNVVKRAESYGLGIAVDWSPDPRDAGKKAAKMLTKEQMSWANPLKWLSMLWDGLGRLARQSEVATRMAVLDTVMEQTGGDATQATIEAMEIINYGRRGSSPLFGTLMSMSPFINGRIQGVDVMVRTHMGAMDAPGLFLEKGQEIDSAKMRKFRALMAARRGSYIIAGTFLYWLMVHDDEEYKNAREDLKNDWWLVPLGGGLPGLKIPIPFEVGVLYKVIPEQIMRMLAEEQHDFRDVRDETFRQIRASLNFDLRPQLIRPAIDAMANRDVFQRDRIVSQWMMDSVAAPEQFNPYTSKITRIIAKVLDKIPLVNNMTFLTSPMKLEYMLRQYAGTLGGYALVMADRLARDTTDEHVAGTAADFPWPWAPGEFDRKTIVNMPVIGDLLFDPEKGGAYQEQFYDVVDQVAKITGTLGQLRQRPDPTEALEFEEKHRNILQIKKRLDYLGKFMDNWRDTRDQLFERTDLSKEDKRRQLYRMYETRDDMLSEMTQILGNIKEDRSVIDQVLGKGVW